MVKPSLIDIHCKLTVVRYLAQEFIQLHPEHEVAVTEFLVRVNQLWKELYHSFYQRNPPG